MKALLALILLAGCGLNAVDQAPDKVATVFNDLVPPPGSILHSYRFLCRTQLELPHDAGFAVLACETDDDCIAAAELSGQADQLRADGYSLGCPGGER